MLQRRCLILLAFWLTGTWGLASSAQDHGTGLKLATKDQLRGVPLASTPFSGAELPPRVDLSPMMPPVGNQGKESSCVGWSCGYALKSYQERLEGRYEFVENNVTRADRVFSPSFIYNQLNGGRDGGCYIIDALNLLSEQGIATWAEMPYIEGDLVSRPTDQIRANAKRFRIDYWRQVNVAAPREIKSHLNAGLPVVIGVTTDDGFNHAAGPNYVWRQVVGEQRGGHAMLIIGYDDDVKAFKVMNSWGYQWGNAGYCWIDYTFFPKVVNEAYVAKDALNTAPRPQTVEPTRPAPVLGFTVTKSNFSYDRPDLGPCLTFEGTYDIPAHTGTRAQIVIHFYYDEGQGNQNRLVRSADDTGYFIDVNKMAACTTVPFDVPPAGAKSTWSALIPLKALDVPLGPGQGADHQPIETWLLASPYVFIDGFGMKGTEPLRFSVKR